MLLLFNGAEFANAEIWLWRFVTSDFSLFERAKKIYNNCLKNSEFYNFFFALPETLFVMSVALFINVLFISVIKNTQMIIKILR